MFRNVLVSVDVEFARLICGLTELFGGSYALVLGCYLCILDFGNYR